MSTVSGPFPIYAAQDPTAAYTFSDAIDMADHRYLEVLVIATGTSPASYEFMWQSADLAAGPWADVPLVEATAGLGASRAPEIALQDPDGTVLSGSSPHAFVRGARRFVRAAVKSTGGAGTDRIAMTATLATE
jgi:hypothetical protein